MYRVIRPGSRVRALLIALAFSSVAIATARGVLAQGVAQQAVARESIAQQSVAQQTAAPQPAAQQPAQAQPGQPAQAAQPAPVAAQPAQQSPVADRPAGNKEIRLAPAFTRSRTTLAAGIRYGTNDLNFGVGVHAGYTLEPQVYIGGAFDYWFGTSETVESFGIEVSTEASGWNVLALAGYDLGITSTFVIRPYGGGGIFAARGEVCTSGAGVPVEQCIEANASDAAGAFGAQLMVLLGSLHLGGELRIIFAEEAALNLGGNIGFVL